jgi:hypothetical protein
MVTKGDIVEKAIQCGFGDIGFTTAEPFESQKALLIEKRDEYEWVFKLGLDLISGTDPRTILPDDCMGIGSYRWTKGRESTEQFSVSIQRICPD